MNPNTIANFKPCFEQLWTWQIKLWNRLNLGSSTKTELKLLPSSNTIRCAHITTICVIFNNVVLSSELFFFYFLETIFLNQEKRHHASTTNFGNEEMVEYTIYLVDFIISLSYWNFSPTILGQKIILTTMVL